MKFVLVLCLLGAALARPQEGREPYEILRSEIDPVLGAVFRYLYETENGIYAEKEGYEGAEGQSNMRGTFTFPLDDGTVAEFVYTADENGYRVESPLIPQAPPLPEHAQEQIRIAEEQRAQGIEFDNQGFRI